MSRRRVSAAVAATLAAPVLAWLAWGSGLDRLSQRSPDLANQVPPALRSHAWRSESALARRQQRPAAALSAAARAVAADPVDPAALSALGAARLASGDSPGAIAAYRLAGALGWRDLPTQLFLLTVAVGIGDFRVAADRLDAVLRQRPTLPQAEVLLTAVEQAAAGRRALAARLALRPPWLGTYLGALGPLDADQLAARARVLAEPGLRPARLTCAEVSSLVGALLAKGHASEARRLQRRFCGGEAGGAAVVDGGFETARLTDAPARGWQFVGEGGLDLRLAPAGLGGRSLVVRSALPVRRVFASQMLQLAPGRYRVGWRARAAGGGAADAIAVRLACQPLSGAFLAARPAGGDRFVAEAEVADACPGQWLELAIAAGAGPVAVDDVTVALTR